PAPEDDEEQPAWLTQRRETTTRAWRAAIIGALLVMCVPILNFYSMYLLFRHGLLAEEPQAPPDWRINATLWLNLAVFALWSVCLMAMLRNGPM
ncbi:MAG TPA: hypothetical protein VL096_12530, partial [Pirellulaceae bacterium]|nr:hypothetical protein [Pirellulaceae bacterium]